MDKYEEAAERYICGNRIFSVDGDNAKALADAFRWHDERLRERIEAAIVGLNAEAITSSRAAEIIGGTVDEVREIRQAIDAMRKPKTCETCEYNERCNTQEAMRRLRGQGVENLAPVDSCSHYVEKEAK